MFLVIEYILLQIKAHFFFFGELFGLGGWRRERMRKLPTETYFTLVPDWVCEVLSPSTRNLDLGAKRAKYAREGVKFLWFVDPIERSLEAFQLLGAKWVFDR